MEFVGCKASISEYNRVLNTVGVICFIFVMLACIVFVIFNKNFASIALQRKLRSMKSLCNWRKVRAGIRFNGNSNGYFNFQE